MRTCAKRSPGSPLLPPSPTLRRCCRSTSTRIASATDAQGRRSSSAYSEGGSAASNWNGGERGIRTLDGLLTHTPLAGERLQPLGHLSVVSVWLQIVFSPGPCVAGARMLRLPGVKQRLLVAVRLELVVSLLGLDPFVDLFPMYGYVFRRVDADSHLVTPDPQHGDYDFVSDSQRLTDPPR